MHRTRRPYAGMPGSASGLKRMAGAHVINCKRSSLLDQPTPTARGDQGLRWNTCFMTKSGVTVSPDITMAINSPPSTWGEMITSG